MSISLRGVATRNAGVGDSLVWETCSDSWDAKTNPDGYVPLGLAENALMHSELRDFFNSKPLVDSHSKALTYGDGPFGSKSLRHILARFFNEHFVPARSIEPEHLIVTNGVTSTVEHCAWNLANPGEGILLGRPYYRAFINSIQLRTGAKVVPVAFSDLDPCGPGCVAKYEEALLESNNNGPRISAIMLCHPHNPLGRCYSKETIVSLMKLCQKYKVHLISDEIYALTIWKNNVDKLNIERATFESVLSIDTRGIINANLIHVLWGTSKDFGANGIRLGVIISQANADFLAACRACCLFSSPSSLAENAVAGILSDSKFLRTYISTNQDRLSAAYTHAVQLLQNYGIEHMPGATAAFFLWLNLGKKYVERHPEVAKENDITKITDVINRKLIQKKVFLVSGDATGAEEPGWFRLVFAQPAECLEEGMRRIMDAIG